LTGGATRPGCRIERLEDLADGLRAHVAAVVAHLEEAVVARSEPVAAVKLGQVLGAGAHHAGRDGDKAAAFAERFGGVEHQVHQDLAQLGRIALKNRQAGQQVQGEHDLVDDR